MLFPETLHILILQIYSSQVSYFYTFHFAFSFPIYYREFSFTNQYKDCEFLDKLCYFLSLLPVKSRIYRIFRIYNIFFILQNAFLIAISFHFFLFHFISFVLILSISLFYLFHFSESSLLFYPDLFLGLHNFFLLLQYLYAP